MKYRLRWWCLTFRHELVDDQWKIWDKERVLNSFPLNAHPLYEALSGLKNIGWHQVEAPFSVVEPTTVQRHFIGFDPPYKLRLKNGRIRFARKSDVTLFKLRWVPV